MLYILEPYIVSYLFSFNMNYFYKIMGHMNKN